MRVVALAGGVGGAKLAAGLQAVLAPGQLSVVVNTGDDLEVHGLLVCPDHDTVLYTLAGIANAETGWGVSAETWTVMDQLGRLGEETWFGLGDRDIATHLFRLERLRAGRRLTEVALELAAALHVPSRILPMADEAVRTQVRTTDGWLDFQEYFVHRQQEPAVHEIRFAGVDRARPTAEVEAALEAAELIVICPSNPFVSVGPILAVPGFREALAAARQRGVQVAAVSPIVAGRALKGPADRMLASLGRDVSALGVAREYRDLVDLFVLDRADAALVPAVAELGLRVLATDTVMTDDATRARLAREILAEAPLAADRGPA
ncbi:MAG TPA: 2-phospho-L-lactate transferase [Candidatus Limnocylindrales bacterium]